MRMQNVTITLTKETLRKAKILAAQRGTTISGLLATQIETLVRQEDEYQGAERQALTLLDKGFHLGGSIPNTRDEWHDR